MFDLKLKPQAEPDPLTAGQGLLAALIVLVSAWLTYRNRYFQLDDALIYYRYVRNFMDGHGLVYNIGERFNAMTSPLHMLLLISLSKLTQTIHQAALIQFWIFFCGALFVWAEVFAFYGRRTEALLGGCLAVALPTYFYSTAGMETALFLFLAGLCLWFFLKERLGGLCLSLALLALTRGEGVLLVPGLLLATYKLKRPWPALKDLAAPVLLVAAYLVFNRLYFGVWLPHTLAAKIMQGRSGLWGPWPCILDIKYQLGVFFQGQTGLVAALSLLALLGVWQLGLNLLTVVAACFLLLYTSFFVVLNIPNYNWYYGPHWLALYLCAGVGLSWVPAAFKVGTGPGRELAGVLAMVLLLALASGQAAVLQDFRFVQGKGSYQGVSRWLRKQTPPDATVAAVEIGALGWYSNRRIIDILGLVTPQNAGFIGQRDFNAWTEVYRPDYIVAHDPLWSHEQSVAWLVEQGRYVVEPRFKKPGLKIYIPAASRN